MSRIRLQPEAIEVASFEAAFREDPELMVITPRCALTEEETCWCSEYHTCLCT